MFGTNHLSFIRIYINKNIKTNELNATINLSYKNCLAKQVNLYLLLPNKYHYRTL